MKFFLFFAMVSAFGGMLFHKLGHGQRTVLLACFVLFIMFGFFFLDMI